MERLFPIRAAKRTRVSITIGKTKVRFFSSFPPVMIESPKRTAIPTKKITSVVEKLIIIRVKVKRRARMIRAIFTIIGCFSRSIATEIIRIAPIKIEKA